METANVETKTATWFEVQAKFNKLQEDGGLKRVTETYALNTETFGDAEKCAYAELQDIADNSAEANVTAIKIAPYVEVFFSKNESDKIWYNVTVAFVTVNEKTGKENRNTVKYLVQADSIVTAQKYVNEVMKDSVMDYDSVSISKSNVIDVWYYE